MNLISSKKFFSYSCALILGVALISSCSGFDEQIMYNEAQRAHNEKEFERAIMLYKKLLKDDPENKIHPDNGIVSFDLGVAYLDSGDPEGAIEQVNYLKSLKLNGLASELEKLAGISAAYVK